MRVVILSEAKDRFPRKAILRSLRSLRMTWVASLRSLRMTAIAILSIASVIACHRPQIASDSVSASPVADSVEGIVRVVGVEALPRTTLVTDDGRTALDLVGSPLLTHVAGLRVAVVGTRDGRTLDVSRFTVLAANGVRAVDGVLTKQGNDVILVTPGGGWFTIDNPSPALQANVGHRVWISGVQDGQTVAYGVID
jgi:hypothetical protein